MECIVPEQLFDVSSDDSINILIFGVAQSGKSLFVNSCYSMINSGSNLITIAQSGSSVGHNTKEIKYYRLADLKNPQKPLLTPFNLVDTWGVDKHNYEDFFFNELLDGQVPSGYSIEKTCLSMTNVSHTKRRIHCAIFFVCLADLNANSEYLSYVKKYAGFASNKGITPLYCISKIDEDMQYANCRSSVPDLSDLIARAAKVFNTYETRVFPIVNYKIEQRKSNVVDCYIYNLLLKACDCGYTNLKNE